MTTDKQEDLIDQTEVAACHGHPIIHDVPEVGRDGLPGLDRIDGAGYIDGAYHWMRDMVVRRGREPISTQDIKDIPALGELHVRALQLFELSGGQ